jgi:hypothetical protein
VIARDQGVVTKSYGFGAKPVGGAWNVGPCQRPRAKNQGPSVPTSSLWEHGPIAYDQELENRGLRLAFSQFVGFLP